MVGGGENGAYRSNWVLDRVINLCIRLRHKFHLDISGRGPNMRNVLLWFGWWEMLEIEGVRGKNRRGGDRLNVSVDQRDR